MTKIAVYNKLSLAHLAVAISGGQHIQRNRQQIENSGQGNIHVAVLLLFVDANRVSISKLPLWIPVSKRSDNLVPLKYLLLRKFL